MTTVAIIAEYNPFHNGHAYQIAQARKLTGADHVVVLMSGDFVQRGEPAIMDKYLRTQMALNGGADFVFELPVRAATASADDYGKGAVRILNDMNCIDYLCFGAENEDLSQLSLAADLFLNETEDFKSCLKNALSSGLSYPRARKTAFEEVTGRNGEFLTKPNNVLAVSYLQALKYTKSRIKPVAVRRIDNYHEQVLHGSMVSATAIRKSLMEKDFLLETLRAYVPEGVYPIYESGYRSNYPVDPEWLWPMLSYRLLMEDGPLSVHYDMPEELENRLNKVKHDATGLEDLCEKLSSPAYTKSRIRRSLLHVLLGLQKTDLSEYLHASDDGYVRLLGFRQSHAELLRILKKQSRITVLHKAMPEELPQNDICKSSYKADIRASELYTLIQRQVYTNSKYIHEFSQKLIKNN